MAKNDRDLVLRISAQNLTADAAKQIKKQLKEIEKQAERSNTKFDKMSRGFQAIGRAAPGAFKAVTKGATATAAAVVAAAGAVTLLAERGGELGAVEESFRSLSAAAGESSAEILRSSQEATAGLVSNNDLMQSANQGLLLGLPITADSMGKLAETALVLGRAMGLDATKSMQDLMTALGRSSPMILDNLGLTVRLGDANSAYAAKLGKTSAELTDAEKKMAFYEATLAAAGAKVEELGGLQLTTGDRIQQSRIHLTNFVDSLSIGISRSPVFAQALKSLNEGLAATFGQGNGDNIQMIVGWIEQGAIMLTGFAEAGITAADFVHRGFSGLKVVFNGVAVAGSELLKAQLEIAATAFEIAAAMPVVGEKYQGTAEFARQAATDVGLMNQSFREQLAESAMAASGNSAFSQSLQGARETLTGFRSELVLAAGQQQVATQATRDATAAERDRAAATAEAKEQLRLQGEQMTEHAIALLTHRDEAAVWEAGLNESLASIGTGVDQTGIAISGIGDLTQVSAARMAQAFGVFGMKSRNELNLTVERAEKAFNLIKESGTATAEELIEMERKLAEFRQQASEQTTAAQLSSGDALMKGSQQLMAQLGGEYKAAAIAGAIISTYQAIAKALASAPWPANLVLAAGAGAAGWANVSKIRSSEAGFAEGTPQLDFMDFGPVMPTMLHGTEAVVPQGSGHQLAGEIARAMPNTAHDERLAMGVSRMTRKLDSLPRAIAMSVRDAMLLAAT